MDKVLNPEKFNQDPNAPIADKKWKCLYRKFVNYFDAIQAFDVMLDKFTVLLSHIDITVHDYKERCKTYEEAIQTLGNIYIKPSNEIFTRHLLTNRRQKPEVSIN